MGDAVRRGHITVNPILAVNPPARDDSVERTAWTADEVRRFLQVASTDRLGAIWRLALATGCRRGEIVGLQWTDVDLDGCSVTIARQGLVRPRSVGLDEHRLYIRETTKSRRVRRVRFDQATAVALRGWKARQAEERLAFGAAYRTGGGFHIDAAWLVTEPNGFVVHPDTLLRRWKALVKAAGVTPITLHGARHSYAELALGAGVRLDVVSRQLGHASIATTGNIYTHDTDEAATEAADRLGNILEGRP
jgi:integrase